jgi:phage/plasmid-associated DNA primase
MQKLKSALQHRKLHWKYQKWCQANGTTPISYREFVLEIEGVFKEVAASGSPTRTPEEFGIAVRKAVGDCR